MHPRLPPAAVVGVDSDGTIVHASEDITAICGWSPDRLLDQPLTTLIPERFHGPHLDGFERFVATGELNLLGRTLHLPARRPDGTEVDIELLLALPATGDPAAIVGTLRPGGPVAIDAEESTVLAAMQTALATDAPLTDVLTSCLDLLGRRLGAPVGAMWILDPWHRRLRTGAVWEAEPGRYPAFARDREEAIATKGEGGAGVVWATGAPAWIADVDLGPDGPAAATGIYLPLLDGDETVGVVELIADDPELTIETQEALHHLAGELGRLLALRLRRDAETAERQRLQLALGARGMGIWTYRFATGEAVWDEQLRRLHGFEPGTTIGTLDEMAQPIHADDWADLRSLIEVAVDRGEGFDYRYRLVSPSGEIRWIEGSGIPIVDLAGELQELTGVCYDITADVHHAAELDERARYSALSADVGKAFVRDTPLPEKLQSAVQAIVDHLGVAFARIWTVDGNSEILELQASAGIYTHIDGGHARVPVGQLKIGRIAASREPHLTNAVIGDPHVSDQEWARREQMRAFAGYPLVIGNRCVGVLALFSREELPESTLAALGAISDTVAIGIDQSHNADEVLMLWEQTRRHAARLEAALNDRARVAEVLQQSLLPPSLPAISGFSLAARYRAGVEIVGGDFYDVLPLGEDRWAFIVGDICGRGADAARLTALARHSLRVAIMLGQSPAEALHTLNQALRNEEDRRFCTALCAILTRDSSGAEVTLGIGGHPPPMIIGPGGIVSELPPSGTLLGLFADARFTESTLHLGFGDTLVAYTDGVTEARRDGRLYGAARLRRLLGGLPGASPKEVVDAVVEAVADFDESARRDDLALLAIAVDPPA